MRSGYSIWATTMEDIPVGIPEFLELCQEVGAEPWIVAPTAMSEDEARKLAEYLAGGAETAGGAMRVAGGQTRAVDAGLQDDSYRAGERNLEWDLRGRDDGGRGGLWAAGGSGFYGDARRGGGGCGTVRSGCGRTFIAMPERNQALLAAARQANTLAIAPYLMHSVTEWGNDDELYGPLMAQPEEMSREGVVQAAQASAGGRQLAVYEVNLHTTEGTAPQAVLDRFTPSAAAGVAVTGHMLRMMRDHGVRDEMLFSLPQFRFKRADGTLVRLWGSVVEMGGRERPQLLAESLANRVMGGNMVRVEVSGEDPTHDQPAGNDGVRLRGVHEIDAYGFEEGRGHGLIVFNYGLHQTRRVSLEGPGLRSGARLWRLVSPGPGASNEGTPQVTIKEERFGGGELEMPPCSMAVLEWQE